MDFIEKLKALIEKLKAIGDAIRVRTGDTEPLTLDEMVEAIKSMDVIDDGTNTYILVDENGYEVPAVLVDEPVMLTANAATDIRKGMTAVTDEGVVTGEKEIPAYNTKQGRRLIKPGQTLVIPFYSDECQYTKLSVIVCEYYNNADSSVSAEMVVINDKLYAVGSTVVLAEVTVDINNQSINLGVTNDGESSLLLRYMTIKEES